MDLHSGSDSAVVGYLYQKLGCTDEMLSALDGIFACVVYDEDTGEFCAFRDPIGICPMYWGRGADGAVWFASEMKAIQDVCDVFDIFPPVRERDGAGDLALQRLQLNGQLLGVVLFPFALCKTRSLLLCGEQLA